MKSNQHWAAAGKALAAVIVTLVVISMSVPGAGAATTKTLYKFTGGADGSLPLAGLIFDTSGNLYSTTYYGGTYGYGTVFQLTPSPDGKWTETVLYSFTGGSDGGEPAGGLVFDATGDLYGTTSIGGDYGAGTVFELMPNPDGSWSERVLHSFSGSDGNYPNAGLIFDAAGNLYSTTIYGGASGRGVVFKLAPNPDGSWTETVLHNFAGGREDGAEPYGAVLLDAAGNLYGTTYGGGKVRAGWECGVVYKLSPNPDGSWTETVLHYFNGAVPGTDGEHVESSLILDAAGNLYGTVTWGSTYDHGAVFELMPQPDGSWKRKQLHRFTTGKDGGNPLSSLTFDGAGRLYGTTYYFGKTRNGSVGWGVVFRLTLGDDGRWREKALHTFANKTGSYPCYGGVIFDAAGNLYGTTRGDTYSTFGTVYQITP